MGSIGDAEGNETSQKQIKQNDVPVPHKPMRQGLPEFIKHIGLRESGGNPYAKQKQKKIQPQR